MTLRTVALDPALSGVLRAGILEAHGVTVTANAEGVWAEIDRLASGLRDRYAGREPAQIDGLQPARDLYKRISEDPTKMRPSSEALLRRVLRGQALYRINSLVDLCNWCSLDFLLPIGLYDLDRMHGAVAIRLGRAGEHYESLAKGTFAVDGRLVVADDDGACGSPTSDSRRTSISPGTRACLMVIFAPAAYDPARLARHVADASERIARWSGGRVDRAAQLP